MTTHLPPCRAPYGCAALSFSLPISVDEGLVESAFGARDGRRHGVLPVPSPNLAPAPGLGITLPQRDLAPLPAAENHQRARDAAGIVYSDDFVLHLEGGMT